MSTLRLGDDAPNFTAQTTEGEINFHQWLGDSWGVLFSHPADYTPVCTTELGTVAKYKAEFDKRNVPFNVASGYEQTSSRPKSTSAPPPKADVSGVT